MKKYLLFFLLSFTNLLPQTASESSIENSFETLVQDFRNILENTPKYFKADSLQIIKPYGLFYLKSGFLYECPPINDEVHALLFIGDGNFKFTPKNEIEEMQLYRFYQKKNLDENFEFLFMLFTDDTYKKLKNNIQFLGAEDYGSYSSRISEAFEYIFDEDEGFLYSDLAYTFLEGKDSTLFYSHFNDNDGDPMFYEVNKMKEEEISLMRKYKARFVTMHETICQFSEHPLPSFVEKNKTLIDGEVNISKYIIEARIEDNLDFSAKATFLSNPKFDNQKWFLLDIYADLYIDSVFIDGEKVNYYKNEESYRILVECKEPLKKSDTFSIDFYYHGDLFEKDELGWISLKSPNYWFPRCNDWENSLFDLTFYVPEKYTFCSVGEEISREEADEEEEIIKYKFSTNSPIRNVSFNLGYFEEYKMEEKDLPLVTVYISDYGHDQMARDLVASGILSKGDMDEKIASDVVNSINLYNTIYGKIPLKNIFVTEIPYLHGEAFPGLIHLSWIAFQGIQDEGMVEKFIAHEVAHQWWGINVDVDSYHDQWLGEAFAEYSGLWYMQLLLKDNDRFFEVLDEWKERIINNRKFLFESGQEAGPIWLGYRTHSSETEGDYQLIIYKKGAWVLHMLRNMLLDLQTMNEDKFENMMKDFFSTYSGKRATTNDFQRIVEKHCGMRMDWFFSQWIYNTAIPEYDFSYKTTKTSEGKYKVRCRVQQSNVPSDFKMFINFLIKFEDDKFARLRLEVNGTTPEFDLPLLPLEPKEIIFNDLNSVLCNVDYIDWE